MRTYFKAGFVVIVCIAAAIIFFGSKDPEQDERRPITLKEFKSVVSNMDTVVLVYCSAEWCGVCRKMKPTIAELETYKPGKLKILHVDADRDKELNEEFELNTLPMIMLYKKGEQKWTWTGLITSQNLKAKIDPHIW